MKLTLTTVLVDTHQGRFENKTGYLLSKEDIEQLLSDYLEYARSQNDGNMILHGLEHKQFIEQIFTIHNSYKEKYK